MTDYDYDYVRLCHIMIDYDILWHIMTDFDRI